MTIIYEKHTSVGNPMPPVMVDGSNFLYPVMQTVRSAMVTQTEALNAAACINSCDRSSLDAGRLPTDGDGMGLFTQIFCVFNSFLFSSFLWARALASA